MNWFLELKAQTKVGAVFGLFLFMLVAVSLVANANLRSLQAAQKRMLEMQLANVADAGDMVAVQNHIRGNLFQMMLATDSASRQEEYRNIQELEATIDDLVERLSQRNRGNPELAEELERWQGARKAIVATREEELVPLIRSGDVDEAYERAMGSQVEHVNVMRESADRIVSIARRNASDAVAESDQEAERAAAIFYFVAATAAVVAIASFLFVNRALRKVTGELNRGIGVLASSSSELTASSSQVAAGASETASAITQTTSTVEEVRQTAQMSSEKAKAVSESSQRAREMADSGTRALQDMSDGMQHIREQMETIAASVSQLSDQGQSIGTIISTVDDIAEQSNLLAVNAAIEAAKAGENGRGFSVVAQEMRDLAEQSKEATAQVRRILNDIQRGVGKAGMASEQGDRSVQEGIRRSNETAAAIRALLDSVAEAAQAAVQIAASSQQQLVGMDQVASAIENIRDASEQNVAATRQVEEAARGLSTLGGNLKQLIEEYRI